MNYRVELNALGEGSPQGIQVRREDRNSETVSRPEDLDVIRAQPSGHV